MEAAGSAAERSDLQLLLAAEQQKAQLQLRMHSLTAECWDKCVEKPGSRLDSRTESCLVSCADRFVDTTLALANRLAQMAQKGGR